MARAAALLCVICLAGAVGGAQERATAMSASQRISELLQSNVSHQARWGAMVRGWGASPWHGEMGTKGGRWPLDTGNARSARLRYQGREAANMEPAGRSRQPHHHPM